MSHDNRPAAPARPHTATQGMSATSRSAAGVTATASPPEPKTGTRRPVALHRQDYVWARATARQLRARGIADVEVERILGDLVEVFVRRGRHGREVYGAPRVQAAFHPSGQTQHVGRNLRRFVGYPLLISAVVALVVALVAGPVEAFAGVAALLAVLGAGTFVLANVRDSRLPTHISQMAEGGGR
jgi:hypothetical protein